jgi:putative ubiquitin-RnfH superfamily antitoxin RatB of RatAB toxin-antitoxin module
MVHVEVAYCPAPGVTDLSALDLPDGSTVADALQASGVLGRHGLQADAVDVGVWFRAAETTALLRDRDRIELYRPLTVDPKEARRLRYRKRAPLQR